MKTTTFILISKVKGDPELPSANRPLCMLDAGVKLFERLLKPRIQKSVEAAGGLFIIQHECRPKRSTLGTIEDVIEGIKTAQSGTHYTRNILLLATLDVRNAFKSASWADMIYALETAFKSPQYIMKMIRSYLQERELICETEEHLCTKKITIQGSEL